MIEFILYYKNAQGKANYSNDFLRLIYQRFKKERTLQKVMPSYEVTEELFLQSFQPGIAQAWFILYNKEFSGIFWLNHFETKTAYVHTCLLKKVWGEKAIEIGKAVLKYWLNLKNQEGEYILDAIYTLCPLNNRLVIKYTEKVGMKLIGELPKATYIYKEKKSISSRLYYATKEEVE